MCTECGRLGMKLYGGVRSIDLSSLTPFAPCPPLLVVGTHRMLRFLARDKNIIGKRFVLVYVCQNNGPCAQIRLGQITHACLSLSRTCILGARISSQVRVISISTNLDLDPVIQTHRLIRFLATSRPRALAPLAPGAWPPRLSQARITGSTDRAPDGGPWVPAPAKVVQAKKSGAGGGARAGINLFEVVRGAGQRPVHDRD